jgi:nucleoside-diphosphate-sugar epimerase
MRVFITGATGFIGSAVVRELVTAGHAVTGLVRLAHTVVSLEAMGAKARRRTIDVPVVSLPGKDCARHFGWLARWRPLNAHVAMRRVLNRDDAAHPAYP